MNAWLDIGMFYMSKVLVRGQIWIFYEIWLTQKVWLWKALCQSGRPPDHCEEPPQRKPQRGSAIISGYWWVTTLRSVSIFWNVANPPKMRRNSSVPHFWHILPLKHNERFNSPIGFKCDFIWNSFPFKSRQKDNFFKQFQSAAALSIDQSVKKCIILLDHLWHRQNDSLIVIEEK